MKKKMRGSRCRDRAEETQANIRSGVGPASARPAGQQA